MLRPLDLLIALHTVTYPGEGRYGDMAARLHISVSAAHRAMASARAARLVSGSGEPIRANIVEFMVHGARYAFIATMTGPARGVPTGAAAPVLRGRLAASGTTLVWPYPAGRSRGDGIEPIYPSVPKVALKSEALHVLLAALDLCRVGSARERAIGRELIEEQVLA